MLFNGKECIVIDGALIHSDGVVDIVADAMMAIVPIVWGESDLPDSPTPSVVGGNEVASGRMRNLYALNNTDLWSGNGPLTEYGHHRGHHRRCRKPRDKK
jgi:hypothetical protein